MNVYVCEYESEGMDCTISFSARSWDAAQDFADRQGWFLLCEIEETDVEYVFTPDERDLH